jgi:hypothetical protein
MKPFLLLFLLPYIGLQAQNYNAALIPDSLKQNAHAVMRTEELKVTITSSSKAVVTHKWAITILDESGDDHAGYLNYYSKLKSLSEISGHLYDANGKELKSVKRKDISDVSYNGENLMTDTRFKEHNFYYKIYPYTIEYEDEEEYNGIFFLPKWQPVLDENFSVQQSTFIVEYPLNYKLRYKQFNYPVKPVTNTNKTNSYKWEINNTKALEYEIFQPPVSEITTTVFIAPVEFEVGGYTGNMESWKQFGNFIAKLNEGHDVLPDKVKMDIHTLTDGINNPQEKIKVLYEYLQKNTHYISVQMGIGSWQPFDAKYVAANGYGDCKALSNYMTSILKEAGINANYVLINSGDGKKGLWEDFPAPYFNHAIMCVPYDKDTMWLECTSQSVSAGFMGSFTGDRKALMITKDGGFVINTPSYKSTDNVQLRNIKASIDETGNMIADVNTRFTGIQQELQHSLIHNANKEEREKYLNESLNLPTYVIEKSEYKEIKGKIPIVDEYLRISAPDYATITGKRLFIKPNLFNKVNTKLDVDKPRKFPIEYSTSFKDVDTISITLPPGYIPEAIPQDASISNKFGKYSISYKVNGNKIDMLRIYERQSNSYPAKDYVDLGKFYEEMYKTDRNRIVLVKAN